MQFNWLDYVSIGVVATVAAIQFLRSTRDFSRVLYETLFIVGAVVAASLLLRPLGNLTRLSAPLLFGGGGYYGFNRYGGAGLGGVLGTLLIILLVLWLLGAL